MNHGSLFSGIGGFDLAAEWMGWNNVFHCEWNPFGQRVLKYYWPNAKSYNDITKSDFSIHRGQIDILTGGFPCQPYSSAGKRLGKEDDRHLWPEMLRAIREIQPRWVVGENVRGLTNWNGGLVFDEVQAEMESQGYQVTPFLLPACAIDAPHRRDRIWFVAFNTECKSHVGGRTRSSRKDGMEMVWDVLDKTGWEQSTNDPESSNKNGLVADSADVRCDDRSDNWEERYIQNDFWASPENKPEREGRVSRTWQTCSATTDSNSQQRREGRLYETEREAAERHISSFNPRNGRRTWQDFPTQSPVCSGNDGFSTGLDGITLPKWRNESIKAAGNAIVPQVALQIFKAIDQYEQLQKQLNLFAA